MSDSWVSVLFAVLSAAAAAVFVAAAARAQHDRLACLSHAAMGVGMVGMFVPALDVVPSMAGVLAFALIASWFVAGRMRADAPAAGRAEGVHLIVAPIAMSLMYLRMTAAPGMAMGSMTGGGAGDTSPLLMALSIVLIAYFVGYACVLIVRLVRGPSSADGGEFGGLVIIDGGASVAVTPTIARTSLARTVTVAHIVMCLLMAVMFLGSV